MCLLLIAYKIHPVYKLIIAANRDEFYERPTLPVHNWPDNPVLIAGKDLKESGTWLGITANGKIAAITNYRDMVNIKNKAPTRGKLVTDFLLNDYSPEDYSGKLLKTAYDYNGYNLIYGTVDKLYYFSNLIKDSSELSAGIYGLSNHLLDTPWPKVVKSKDVFSDILSEPEPSKEKLFELLKDNEVFPEENLPETGLEKDVERMISPIFTVTTNYGTRSSSIIMVDNDNKVSFIEKSLNKEIDEWGTASFSFTIKNT